MFRLFVPALVAPLFLAAACATAVDEATPGLVAVTPTAIVRAAPDRVAAMVTGRVDTDFTLGDAHDQLSFTGAATFDDEADRLSLTLEMGAQAGPDRPGDSVLEGLLEMVVAGDAAYVRGSLVEEVTGGVGWLAVPTAELGRVEGVLGLPGAGADPRQMLEALRGVGQVEPRGQADVRGVRTTRYDARLELNVLRGGGPVSVWIDGDGLVRRLRIVLAATPLDGQAAGGQLTTVMELFDYGEPVVIAVPPPGEVTSLAEVWR